MGEINRRKFLKTLGVVGATATGIPINKLLAESKTQLSEDRMGVLVDTTVCIGCRRCEWACKKANNLPAGDIESYSDESVFEKMRRPGNDGYTRVNRYENIWDSKKPTNVFTYLQKIFVFQKSYSQNYRKLHQNMLAHALLGRILIPHVGNYPLKIN